jgi:hypothetical protein
MNESAIPFPKYAGRLLAWALGLVTALAALSIQTYYRAEQVPEQAATLQNIQTTLATMSITLASINQRLDDAQRERDQLRADVNELRRGKQ